MLGNILSRILGLGREQVTSWLFGTGDLVAAFTIADNVHTMLFDLVISGMMQAALIPVLSEYAAPERRAELRRIVGALLTLAGIVVGAVVVALIVFAPAVVAGMTALAGEGDARGAETTALTVELVRLILPAVWLLALATILMATLYALQRFARPALSLSVRNLAIIVTALALGQTSVGIRALPLGIVLGALLLVVLLLPGLRDAVPRPNFGFGHPAIRRIGLLYLPIFLGLFVNTAALVVDRNLAWGVGEDALGAMRYATTMNQMVLGFVAAAISLAALPTLSRYGAAGDDAAFFATLARGLRMIAVLVVPATVGLAVLAGPAVRLLFQHGATTDAGARAITLALLIYLPGTLFAAFDQALIFAWYARQNTLTPQIVGVLAVGVYFVVALSLVGVFGMAGLVAANSAQFIFHTLVMAALARALLARHPAGRPAFDTPRLVRTLRDCALASGVMAVAAGGLAWLLEAGLPVAGGGAAHLGRELLLVALPAAAGVAVYAGGLWVLRVEEARVIQRRLWALAGRAPGGA
jgi:putative peptidoglycan lipid II flippase